MSLDRFPWRPYGRETTIVFIDDDSYWHGEAAARVPLNRHFLAKVVKEVAKYRPAVIAIAVSLSSEDPTGRTLAKARGGTLKLPVAKDYAEETADLLDAIREASLTCKVVLPKTIGRDGSYVTRSDVYDGFDFKLPDREQSRVSWGYILLHEDVRHIPRILPLADGTRLDSFALAAVRARHPRALNGTDWEQEQLALFLSPDDMDILALSTLLDSKPKASELSDKLEGQIVLIGGGWSIRGPQSGEHVDLYRTPYGTLPGTLVNASYIEDLLGRQTVTQRDVAPLVDVLVGAVFAILLGMEFRLLNKTVVFVGIFLISYIITVELLVHFAILCDLILIDIGLCFHLFAEPYLKGPVKWCEPYGNRVLMWVASAVRRG